MLYKNDWDMAKRRFEAFWECDMLDRCCISITAPRKNPPRSTIELKAPESLWQQWTDAELAYRTYSFVFEQGCFAGEAFPSTAAYLGPGVLAAFIGSDYTLKEDTVWYGREPVLKELDGRLPLTFNKQHELWIALRKMTEYYSINAPGKHIVAMTDLGGTYDVAVSLRGTQDLLYDLIDRPEEVVRLIGEIDEIWFEAFDALYSIIAKHCEGMSSWIPLYYPGRWYPLQCDFSANMSPTLFDAYVKPSLEREAAFLDRAVYHLDGPDAVKFLDSILDIDRIHGIQWVPGDTGVPESSVAHDKWFPLYEKIQKKKKCLVLMDVKPEEIGKILSRISSKGLFLTTVCNSEDEAEELLRLVRKWSRP